jgi:iron complex transport system substrate-binding protein
MLSGVVHLKMGDAFDALRDLMKNPFKICTIYCTLGSLILSWWFLAFKEKNDPLPSLKITQSTDCSLTLSLDSLFARLSSFNRQELQKALSGDQKLMIEWIIHWNADADQLTKQGVVGIQKLPIETYLKAHVLAGLLQQLTSEQRFQLNCQLRNAMIEDDHHHSIKVTNKFNRFLAQTHVSASFLLALADSKEIIAIPRGLRFSPQLYSPSILENIPENSEHYSGEKLFLSPPDLAFVAPYSHPSMIEMLRNQGMTTLCMLRNIQTVKDIQETLLKTGHLTNHILEANLLQIFMEACFISLDNRLRALHQLIHPPGGIKNFLFLYYHQYYRIPTTRCLSGQLLERILSLHPSLNCPISFNQQEWRIPFDQEKIIQSKPDCLIICTPYEQAFKKRLATEPAFANLPTFPHVCYVDEVIQESPTQYIALAYFDLIHALATTYLP